MRECGRTNVGQLCPILKGVGYATMTIVFLLDIYYCIIIAWTILYLINSFARLPGLPWSGCGKFRSICDLLNKLVIKIADNWWNTEKCFSASKNLTIGSNESDYSNFTIFVNGTRKTTTPVEEFFE